MNGNLITYNAKFNEYSPFTINATNTDVVQVSGVITKEDIKKLDKMAKKPTSRNIRIKKGKNTSK